jgi:ribosomal protein L9
MFFQNKQRNIEILEALANGVDPISGEVFPADSPYQQTEIIRVLFNAINELKKGNNKTTKTDSKKENQGNKWLDTEEEKLKENFNKGYKISELATMHGRTYGAIRSRLVKLD